MKCDICGAENRSTVGLVEAEDSVLESRGAICQRCVSELKEQKPDSLGCGYPNTEAVACSNEAWCGTGSLTRMREPSSLESVESVRSLELRLLCHEHAKRLLDEEQPPWANVYVF